MRRHRSAGFAAVLALDDGAELFQGHTPFPYLQQGADDGPHHVAQETVGLDTEHQQTVLLKPTRFHDLAVVGLHLSMDLRETRKVLVFKEDVGGFLHLGNVQITIKEIGIVNMERILRACDIIMIGARHGIETGMHLRRNLPNPINHNVLGKEGIHLMGKHFRVFQLLLYVEMSIIVPCVDTRVGAPTTCDGYSLPQLKAQTLLHRGLHAVGVRLNLVAMVAAAVVGHFYEVSRHILLFGGTKIEKNLIRNAECGMLNAFSIIQHSAFLHSAFKKSLFLRFDFIDMNILYQLNDDDCFFPPADRANKDGLLAFGGDLSPQRLVVAYANGIFPWYNEDEPLLWWSLDPRLIIRPGEMRVSKSLRHTLRSGKFEVRMDTNFREVMLHCAETPRKDQDGTWIQDEMVDAYCELHDLGIAHSFESYQDGELVGGLYGIAIGKAFFGESMFHTVTDASKVAFYHLHQFLQAHDFKLIDCQQETEHLMSLGAYSISRKDFLDELKTLTQEASLVGKWGTEDCEELYLNIKQPEKLQFRAYNMDEDVALSND